MEEKLIDFLLYLNEKKLINNYDFSYEDEAKQFLLCNVSCQREQLVCEHDNIIDRSLTKGKSYEKIHEHKGMVVIINDLDELQSYNKKAFFEQTNCN